MTAWIFQCNPNAFDLDGYLAATPVVLWTVNQKHLASQISIGDRVFFWRAGGQKPDRAGVVAAGRIDSAAAEMPQDAASIPFARDTSLATPQLRVRIAVEGIADSKSVISRLWLKDDPILSTLRILRLATETNYLLSDLQADRLERLWSNTGRDWNEEESLAGLWAYVRTRGGAVSRLAGSPVSDVALAIGRAVTSVYNKVMNFRAIDPTDSRSGLSGGGATDREVWSRYFNNETQTLDVGLVTAD
jgi:hypothetical protein